MNTLYVNMTIFRRCGAVWTKKQSVSIQLNNQVNQPVVSSFNNHSLAWVLVYLGLNGLNQYY